MNCLFFAEKLCLDNCVRVFERIRFGEQFGN